MATELVYVNNYALKDETTWLTTCLNERIDAVSDRFGDFKDDIQACKVRIDELFCLIRPVLDAQTDKPKQKWLWEIFEPNDIEIDFPYNI